MNVSKSYEVGDNLAHIIRDLTLTLNAGEIVSIVGPSGCGKSTLLNVISGLLPPSSGSVFWYGECLSGVPARTDMMEARKSPGFQDVVRAIWDDLQVGGK